MSSIPRGDIEADSSISCTREAGTWTERGGGQDDVLGLDACSSSSLIPLGKEIRVRDEAGIFEMMYLATRPEGVYVLHCFQKKTQRTSRSDLELATKRFKSITK
jgi:phage-related protein